MRKLLVPIVLLMLLLVPLAACSKKEARPPTETAQNQDAQPAPQAQEDDPHDNLKDDAPEPPNDDPAKARSVVDVMSLWTRALAADNRELVTALMHPDLKGKAGAATDLWISDTSGKATFSDVKILDDQGNEKERTVKFQAIFAFPGGVKYQVVQTLTFRKLTSKDSEGAWRVYDYKIEKSVVK